LGAGSIAAERRKVTPAVLLEHHGRDQFRSWRVARRGGWREAFVPGEEVTNVERAAPREQVLE
jgi:hypothetical protein